MLVIRGISVHYRLRLGAEHRELVERVHEFHARFCPVARTLEGSVAIETDFELVD